MIHQTYRHALSSDDERGFKSFIASPITPLELAAACTSMTGSVPAASWTSLIGLWADGAQALSSGWELVIQEPIEFNESWLVDGTNEYFWPLNDSDWIAAVARLPFAQTWIGLTDPYPPHWPLTARRLFNYDFWLRRHGSSLKQVRDAWDGKPLAVCACARSKKASHRPLAKGLRPPRARRPYGKHPCVRHELKRTADDSGEIDASHNLLNRFCPSERSTSSARDYF